MQLKYNKKWFDNLEIYTHLYQTFVIEDNRPNFVDGVPTYKHKFTGCAIGNLVKSSLADRIEFYSHYYKLWNFSEVYTHLQNNSNNGCRQLRIILKDIFGAIDLEFLQDLQELHDSRQLTKNGFDSVKWKYQLCAGADRL